MINYEQIKDVEKQLYQALSDFKYVIESNDFKDVLKTARKYELESRCPISRFNDRHRKMINRLYTYIVNKIPREFAKQMILDEFHHNTPVVIARVVDDTYILQNHKMRANKIYAAHMMKKAGVTHKKIAAVLGVSAPTVAQYLKIELEIKTTAHK